MSDKPGRNSPCPCGSGLKFKKCCRDKGVSADAVFQEYKNDAAIKRPIKDYGPAVLSKEFFAQNPVHEFSAPSLMYFRLMHPQADRLACEQAQRFVRRGEEEKERILKTDSLEGLLCIMGEKPDPFNHTLLIGKILCFHEEAILKIIEKLKFNRDDVFVELAVRIICGSKIDCSVCLLGILDNIEYPYTLSQVCLLLGFVGTREAVLSLLWNYFHYLREEYPQEYFCEGPLLALAELNRRSPNIRTLSHRRDKS